MEYLIQDVKIDEEKVLKLRRLIYIREGTNLKTEKYKDSEMKEKIRKLIEQEVDKCY